MEANKQTLATRAYYIRANTRACRSIVGPTTIFLRLLLLLSICRQTRSSRIRGEQGVSAVACHTSRACACVACDKCTAPCVRACFRAWCSSRTVPRCLPLCHAMPRTQCKQSDLLLLLLPLRVRPSACSNSERNMLGARTRCALTCAKFTVLLANACGRTRRARVFSGQSFRRRVCLFARVGLVRWFRRFRAE